MEYDDRIIDRMHQDFKKKNSELMESLEVVYSISQAYNRIVGCIFPAAFIASVILYFYGNSIFKILRTATLTSMLTITSIVVIWIMAILAGIFIALRLREFQKVKKEYGQQWEQYVKMYYAEYDVTN